MAKFNNPSRVKVIKRLTLEQKLLILNLLITSSILGIMIWKFL